MPFALSLNSYVILLSDDRVFRRTRRDINIDNSQSAGFGGVGSHPKTVVRRTRPAVTLSSIGPGCGFLNPQSEHRAQHGNA